MSYHLIPLGSFVPLRSRPMGNVHACVRAAQNWVRFWGEAEFELFYGGGERWVTCQRLWFTRPGYCHLLLIFGGISIQFWLVLFSGSLCSKLLDAEVPGVLEAAMETCQSSLQVQITCCGAFTCFVSECKCSSNMLWKYCGLLYIIV